MRPVLGRRDREAVPMIHKGRRVVRRLPAIVLISGASILASACDSPELAYGDVNSIIVGATTDVWDAIQDSLHVALEPSIMTTVAREEVFQITHHDPTDSMWVNLRKFKQLLLVGTAADPWIRIALEAADADPNSTDVVRAFDVWARGQVATVVPLHDASDTSPLLDRLAELREGYLESYRTWALSRMFASGLDSARVDTLRQTAGFSLQLPAVYDWERSGPVFLFRNDNPDPAELIRQFAVTWQDDPGTDPSTDELLAWRDELASNLYDPRQISDTELLSERRLQLGPLEARRVQAVWKNPPEADWPAAGNFIVQSVRCPDQNRLYLVDAWLYAPGKDKFEYLIQLETILNSFRCGEAMGSG